MLNYLWCIARSPLILGCDLVSTPESTMKLFKNQRVIDVNQTGVNSRQIFRDFHNNESIWMSDIPASLDHFVALFNISDEERTVKFNFEIEMLRDKYRFVELWEGQDMGIYEKEFSVTLPPHGSKIYKMTKIK